jgi:hypothetical protein
MLFRNGEHFFYIRLAKPALKGRKTPAMGAAHRQEAPPIIALKGRNISSRQIF